MKEFVLVYLTNNLYNFIDD